MNFAAIKEGGTYPVSAIPFPIVKPGAPPSQLNEWQLHRHHKGGVAHTHQNRAYLNEAPIPRQFQVYPGSVSV